LFGSEHFAAVWRHHRGHPANRLHGQRERSRRRCSRKRVYSERNSSDLRDVFKQHHDNLPLQRLTRGRGPKHDAYSSLRVPLRRTRGVCV
jgi:hypothetical protein